MSKPKVLITGASSGVGLSLVGYLAERFEVIALARRTFPLDCFEGVSAYSVDLSNLGEAGSAIDSIMAEHGDISYVINNAGVMVQSHVELYDFQELERSININALAPTLILQKLLPCMKNNNFGRVINVTSGAPLNNFPNYGIYSGSKALLNSLTVTIAREYSEFDIKVNLMSPGPVKSEMSPEGPMDPSVCFPTVDYLLGDSLEKTASFFWLGHEVPLTPNLEGVDWLKGQANGILDKVLF